MTDRGVSVALDYIILLMIATVMLAGVVAVSASLIDSQVDRGVENELKITGESLAGEVQEVEGLANATDTNETTIERTVELPDHVGGTAYRIEIVDDGGTIELSATGSDHTVTVPVAAQRLAPTDDAIPGGTVRIELTEDDGTIEVKAA